MIRRWREQRRCFHHDWRTGESWITGRIIDPGKMFRCRKCERMWFV